MNVRAIELQKWVKTISVSMSRYMAFKSDFFLMLIAPSFVFMAVNYSVWRSIYQSQAEHDVGGYSMDQMLHYQCWSFITMLLIRSHRTWNLSENIRYGRITSYLLYPFDAWKFYAAEFLAFQIFQLATAVLAIAVLHGCGLLSMVDPGACVAGIVFSLLVSVLWFAFDFMFGIVAFWLDEVWVFRITFNFLAVFFSGAFIPLELFPDSLQKVLEYTPFPLLTAIPVHIFLGTETVSLGWAVTLVSFWTIAVATLAGVMWRRGVRLYAAAGM